MASAGNKTVEAWEKMFNDADKDKSGTLSKPEFMALLQSGGSKVPPSVCDEVFNFFNAPNGDNVITKDEFKKGLTKIAAYMAELKHLFDKYDCDKSGYLDKAEFEKLLRDFSDTKCPLTKEEVNKILTEADKSKDGKICFEEFMSEFA